MELRAWGALAREIPAVHMWGCWQRQPEAGRSNLCPQVYDTCSACCRVWLAGCISSHWTWGYRGLSLLWFWLLSHRICNEFFDPDSGFVFRVFFFIFAFAGLKISAGKKDSERVSTVTKIWFLQYLFLEIKKIKWVSADSVPLVQSMHLVAQS